MIDENPNYLISLYEKILLERAENYQEYQTKFDRKDNVSEPIVQINNNGIKKLYLKK
jgi:hypothetical protein